MQAIDLTSEDSVERLFVKEGEALTVRVPWVSNGAVWRWAILSGQGVAIDRAGGVNHGIGAATHFYEMRFSAKGRVRVEFVWARPWENRAFTRHLLDITVQ